MKINKLFDKLNKDDMYVYAPWDKHTLEDTDKLYYGHLNPYHKNNSYEGYDILYIPPVASGSDYSGDDVHLSNYEALKRDFIKRSKYVYDCYGSYGTYGIAFNITRLKGKLAEELAEILIQLQDNYPLYDEEYCSEVKMRLEEEWWQGSYSGSHDFKKELKSSFEKLNIKIEITDDEDVLWEAYRKLMEGTNTEVLIESGCSVWVDFDKLCKTDNLEWLITYDKKEYDTTLLEKLIYREIDWEGVVNILQDPARGKAYQAIEDEHVEVAQKFGIMNSDELKKALEYLDMVKYEYGLLENNLKDTIPTYLGKVIEEASRI